MKRAIPYIVLVLLVAMNCAAQTEDRVQPTPTAPDATTEAGLTPLVPPYAISTAPHFAVLVEFPRADSIRRIALGDSNYYLAEADKGDPHYAIIKQIRASGPKASSPIETNMLVYMASGRVVNIMLKSGKLAATAYSVDYPVPNTRAVNDPPPTPPKPKKPARERAQAEIVDKMLADLKNSPKDDAGIAAGGLTLRFYDTERLNNLAFVSFDIENTTNEVIDLEGPQLNLVTASEKSKDRKKGIPAKIEPIDISKSILSSKQLAAGARAIGVIVFNPPVHDSDQHIVLSVANRTMADQPASYRVE